MMQQSLFKGKNPSRNAHERTRTSTPAKQAKKQPQKNPAILKKPA
jgi:hypothetical protein